MFLKVSIDLDECLKFCKALTTALLAFGWSNDKEAIKKSSAIGELIVPKTLAIWAWTPQKFSFLICSPKNFILPVRIVS